MNRALHPFTPPKNTSQRIDDRNLVDTKTEIQAEFPRFAGLERWELLKKLGHGGFSTVYQARDLDGKAGEVAIKIVDKCGIERANILKEVQIMRQLDDPNIIKLIDFSESRKYYYIILELAPGGELYHQIQRLTYLSEDLSRHIITQVAKALEYLHEQKGIVHRDIKLENILFEPIPFIPSKHQRPTQPKEEKKVDEGKFTTGLGSGSIGHIKIADFGLSKIIWDDEATTPCGTAGYTAPEIIKGEPYSKSVDIWALGCVLYTLLCGFPPFYNANADILKRKVATGQFAFRSPWWDDISQSAQNLIRHSLTADPYDRYTIHEFLNHPWIRTTGPAAMHEKCTTPENMQRAINVSNFIGDERCRNLRLPGAINPHNVLNGGSILCRPVEECKKRGQVGPEAADDVPSPLPDLSEELDAVDEKLVDMYDDTHNECVYRRDSTKYAMQALQQATRTGMIRDGEQCCEREERHADGKQQTDGQDSASATGAESQHIRVFNGQKRVFELNLDRATMLGRRRTKSATRVNSESSLK